MARKKTDASVVMLGRGGGVGGVPLEVESPPSSRRHVQTLLYPAERELLVQHGLGSM